MVRTSYSNEMMMMSALYWTLSWIFIELAYWNKSTQRQITPLRHIILIPSQPVFADIVWCCMFRGEAAITNLIVFGLTWTRSHNLVNFYWSACNKYNICVLGYQFCLFLHFRLGFEIIATLWYFSFPFYVHVDIITKDKKSTLRKSIIQYSHCLELGWLKFPVESNFYRSPELRCV